MWPLFTSAMSKQYMEATKEMGKVVVSDNGTAIPCHTFGIHMDPVKAPTLPDLPDLLATGLSKGECRKETKLIKIAAVSRCFIGLTNKGHILKLDGFKGIDLMPTWHYVSGGTDDLTCSQLGYTATKVL